MLDPQAGRRQFPVLLTLFRGQRRYLRGFVRCHRVTVMRRNALVNVPVVAEVREGAVFPSEFKGEEELFARVESGRPTRLFLGLFSLVQDGFHLGEGFGVDPGVPFEARAVQLSEAFRTVVAHSRRVAGDFRRRSNFGGNRQLNRVLHLMALIRLRCDERTKTFVARKEQEGKTKRAALRALKTHLARELYRTLQASHVGGPIPAPS